MIRVLWSLPRPVEPLPAPIFPVPAGDALRIKAEVCAKRGVTLVDIASRRRTRPIAYARHELAYRLNKETALCWTEIAAHCGVYDHTSALYGAKAHAKRMGA